ncbi:hypothetical protein ACLQ25_21450 [Micromonospora sp. DT44]|uniref:hypothetical protein n=1 Tax=Micromonospora sp. DT44 TaxID=3393439 RepID=UPI003CF90EB9
MEEGVQQAGRSRSDPNGAEDVVDTRGRNPNVTPQQAMVDLWKYLPSKEQLLMAGFLVNKANETFTEGEQPSTSAERVRQQLQFFNRPLNEALDQLEEGTAGVNETRDWIQASALFLKMVETKLRADKSRHRPSWDQESLLEDVEGWREESVKAVAALEFLSRHLEKRRRQN